MVDDTWPSPAPDEAAPRKERKSQATRALELIAPLIDLFHDADHNGYADVEVDGHRETMRLDSEALRHLLVQTFFHSEGRGLSAASIAEVKSTLAAQAVHVGPCRIVGVRSVRDGDATYIDLGDSQWTAVRVSSEGWALFQHADTVRHWRPSTLRPLPVPGHDRATLKELADLLPGGHDTLFLALPWLIGCIIGLPPFPVLVLRGPEGSGKSTLAEMLRNLVDPAEPALRGPVRDERDLAVATRNSFVLGFDNLSRIPEWLADALCRFATGGGFSTRTLFTNDAETSFAGTRPILLNGIPDLLDRPDLVSRSIAVTLPAIHPRQRRRAAEFRQRFESRRAALFALLLDIAGRALAKLPGVHLEEAPRLADYAHLLVAVGRACDLDDSTFLAPFLAAQGDQQASNLAVDAVADALQQLLDQDDAPWAGTATELSIALERMSPAAARSRDWPRAPHVLANRLRRLEVPLAQLGIRIQFSRSGDRREIILTRAKRSVTGVTAS